MLQLFALVLLFTSVVGQEVCNDYKSCVDRCFVQGNTVFASQITKGAPGKRGPQGPPGPHGRPGPTGQCECGIDIAIQELTRKIDIALKLSPTDAKVKYCSLGVKFGGAINDSAFSQNARYSSNGYGDVHQGRLHVIRGSGSYGSWFPSKTQVGEWIQVDLGETKDVHSIVTQGRDGSNQWTKTYSVQYGATAFILKDVLNENRNKRIFEGNMDRNNYALQVFSPPLSTRFVRIYPLSWNNHPCLRFDLLNC